MIDRLYMFELHNPCQLIAFFYILRHTSVWFFECFHSFPFSEAYLGAIIAPNFIRHKPKILSTSKLPNNSDDQSTGFNITRDCFRLFQSVMMKARVRFWTCSLAGTLIRVTHFISWDIHRSPSSHACSFYGYLFVHLLRNKFR